MSNVFVHIGLTVTDIERSRRFYEGAFGFRFDRDLRMSDAMIQPLMQLDPPSHIHAVYLMLGPMTLELMEWRPGARTGAEKRVFVETGLTHLSISVDDIPAVLDRVTSLGGTIQANVGRAAMVRDPDGQLIELMEMAINEEIEKGRAERVGR